MKQETDKSKLRVTDRRFWAEDESMIDNSAVPDRRYPSYVEELRARTELAEKRLRDRLEELQKENEAFRLRLEKGIETRAEQQKLGFLTDFLEVLDNFERALDAAHNNSSPEALKEGVQLTLELFRRKLQAAGVVAFDLSGEPFDPHQAEAVGAVSVDDPGQDQRVLEVVRCGYRLGEQLLRPARVRIGLYQPPPSDETSDS